MIRQQFSVNAPVGHAFEIGAQPQRFPSFVPLLKRVESTDALLDHAGASYTMVFGLLGRDIRFSWQVEEVRPPDLASSPRPAPPWEIVELGRFAGFEIKSTTRYLPAGVSSVVSHVVTITAAAGLLRPALQPLVSLAARLGMGVVGQRFSRYAGSRSSL